MSTQIRKNKNILFNQYSNCKYCGKELSFREATIDHIKPKSRGGNSNIKNLCLACYPCNQNKGTRRVFYGKILDSADANKLKFD